MRDRSEQILRVFCLALAALVLVQFIRAGCHVGALVGVKIPPVPALETNSVPGTNATVAINGSNTPPARIPATNSPKSAVTGTNAAPDKPAGAVPTNAAAGAVAGTNPPAAKAALRSSTNDVSPANIASMPTNPPATVSVPAGTNPPAGGTNVVALKIASQNGANGPPVAGTNSVAAALLAKTSGTNPPPGMAMAGAMGAGGFPMMPGMPGPAVKLPPEIQARVDKIVDSEIFAPVMRPQPMALLGIAGDTAFLRATSGQTGLVKEGDSLGEIKLLRIGTNRVLVGLNGQTNELMIFGGYGGNSLLSQPNESSK